MESDTPATRPEAVRSVGLTELELRDIAARASTLDERLSGPFQPVESVPRTAARARLQRWYEQIARGDREQLRHRLRWDGWDEESVLGALGGVRLDEQVLPEWAELLREAGGLAAASTLGDDRAFLDGADPLPFEEIVAPFVLAARRRLYGDRGRSALLTDHAGTQLERALLGELTATAAPALYARFSAARIRSQSPLDRIVAAGSGSDVYYRAYVDGLLKEGLAPLFQELPVLARMVAQTALFWSQAVRELFDRLARDRDRLAALFNGGVDPGMVAGVKSSLSDPHRGRRRVMALTFASGLKLVYKPKSLGTEEAYGRLLAWLNERGVPLPFKLLRVLDRGDYGWVEHVEQRPCLDREMARRYYTRAGMLLALLHALEATDCHRDNLLAHGEHPILLDTETLMHHRGQPDVWEGNDAREAAEDLLGGSVLRVGLLPVWSVHGDQLVAYDVSALAGAAGQAIPFERQEWTGINTDAMTLSYRPGVMPAGENVAILDGEPLQLDAYAEEFQTGFAQMYRALIACREDLLQPGSPLHQLASQPVRSIRRHSRVYGAVLRRLREPSHLRDGADWSIELEALTRAAIPRSVEARVAGARPRAWAFFRSERAALTRGDIPLFLARPTEDSMEVDGEVIPHCFEEPSLARVERLLQEMDDSGLERECAFIRAAIYAGTAREPSTAMDPPDTAEPPEELSRDDLVREALELAEETRRHALIAGNGGATWVVPLYLVRAMRYQIAPADHSLYSGAPGIALFLAAVAAVSGDKELGDLALAALRPLRRSLAEQGPPAGRHMALGAAEGIGSVCYALTRIGLLLNEPELLQDARAFALMLTDRRVAEDERLDVTSGSAGALLGIMPLYDVTGDGEILDRAVACGRRLLAARRWVAPGMAAWPTMGETLMTGFAHGAAGISYALLRLHRVTGEQSLLDAAAEAVTYEDSQFHAEQRNWLDLRSDEQPAFRIGWCHGAPGVALARGAGLAMLDTPRIRADLEAGLDTTIAAGSRGPENLCCGTFGRMEILLALAGTLNRPSLTQEAWQIASQVVARARRRGRYAAHQEMPPGLHAPGFFRGTSGVGYTLLRLAYPDRLPSVLLFE